jgi:hypothetical protein
MRSVPVSRGLASSTICKVACCGACRAEHHAAALDDLGHQGVARYLAVESALVEDFPQLVDASKLKGEIVLANMQLLTLGSFVV